MSDANIYRHIFVHKTLECGVGGSKVLYHSIIKAPAYPCKCPDSENHALGVLTDRRVPLQAASVARKYTLTDAYFLHIMT
jgi:hypothetical protein